MKMKIIPINFCNNVGFSMKSFVRIITVLSMLALLSGCAGLMIDSISKSKITGKTYGELATTLPPSTDGSGRLFIYRTKASTKTSLVYGSGLVKNPTLCTVDDTAYQIIWETFRYIDLPKGKHEVTCGKDVVKITNAFTMKYHYQKGANEIQVIIPNAADIFVRVEATKEKPYFQPVLVEGAQGRKEILNVPHQKGSSPVHKYPGGKISEQ